MLLRGLICSVHKTFATNNVLKKVVSFIILPLVIEGLTVILPSEKNLRNFNYLRLFFIFAVFLMLSIKKESIGRQIALLFKRVSLLRERNVCKTVILGNLIYCICALTLYYLKHGTFYYGYVAVAICGAVIINALLLYVTKVIRSIETLFFLCSISIVVAAIFSVPLYANYGDAAKHFDRIIKLANVYTGVHFPQYSLEEQYSVEQLYKVISYADSSVAFQDTLPWFSDFTLLSYRYIAYLPYCFGLVFADALLLSPTAAYYAGVVSNAVFILYVYTRAMKKLRSGKLILAAFVLLPYTVRLLSIYTYTTWVWAFLTYAAATVIGSLQKDAPVAAGEAFAVLGAYLLAFFVKPPYFIMGAFACLLLEKEFCSPKQKRCFGLLASLVMAAGIVLIILPALISPTGFELYSDTRGGSGVSAVGQLKHIFLHPLQYGILLVKTMLSDLSPDALCFGPTGICNFRRGLLCDYAAFFPALLFMAILLDRNEFEKNVLTWKNRLISFGIVLLNSCIIATTMYMNYSEVGSSAIAGATSLYYVAAFFPMLHMMGTKRIEFHGSKRVLNAVTIGSASLLLLYNVYIKLTSLMI